MSNGQRIGILVAAVVALAVAFVVLSGGDDEGDVTADTVPAVITTETRTSADGGVRTVTEPAPPPKPEVPEIVVRDGQPVGGVERIEVRSGKRARFTVRSAGTPDEEVHLHGYDIEKPLKSGGQATFTFEADAEGVFEIELHGSAVQIGELRVVPG